MSSLKNSNQIPGIKRNIHFWAILGLFLGLVILHYIEELNISGSTPSWHFGLERHAMDRILFLLPIIYALSVFGLAAGTITTVAALLVMLPRAIIWSPNPRDAFFEIACVALIAIAIHLWFEARIKALEQRKRAAAELDTVQEELQSHIRLSRANEIRLTMLNAISGMLSYSLELGSLLRSAIDIVMEVLEVEVVLIFSLDDKSEELKLIAHKGVTESFAQQKSGMKVGEGFNGLVVQTGEPLLVEDASSDPRLTREAVKREKIAAQLIVPLKAKGQPTGTICVANRRPRRFLPEEVQLLSAIANQIAIAMENARLYEEQQVTAEQYRGIFENASDAIWVQDIDGNILTANEATARLTGYNRQELFQMKAASFLPENDSRGIYETEHKLLSDEYPSEPYDQQIIRKDGTKVLSRLTSNIIISDGEPVGLQHIARDVTKEKQMEENLHFYIEEVTRAQEEERKRIARELHDETTQQLVGLANQLEDFTQNNDRLSSDDIRLLGNLRSRLKNTLQGLRWFIRELRPPLIDDLGLRPAMEWLARELQSSTDIKVDFNVAGNERRFSPEAELLLFRMVQEALTNVRRHAEASVVEVLLEFSDSKININIKDNGKGFHLPNTLGELSHRGKLGLIGMEERARLLRAKLSVQSKPAQGTTVLIELTT